ncbi:UDP-N-acetylmuramoyl-tripeptide--D-alanyl-D-alanine ligase [Lihuaxuella thermophila]|uniref:UDP-N-acetylmuramoyl-tripeptide--D-alanyl-D-alanine ligase n=1 Tax=Lihuaxuella thermophila TaxID=1173111 RepID=A0A1H8GE44_9BACL|nr:UDP-N-acetylmuramoyl-tripeptide--D-alanyl-D-alanine ligase [Lihuaxuella thermophila]SEN42282.1 UDP-N-acetylmuramoyl-tripeptide--D-alanyl-D-alanine ligase [Lihuaxuella thermophila]
MKTISLGTLAKIAKGRLLSGNPSATVNAVNFGKPKKLQRHHVYFYTRKINWSKQLAAIKRVRPLAVVLPAGISSPSIPSGIGVIRVQDAFTAFWNVAKWNWSQISVKVVGITGSAGKSTTTEMLASILKYRWPMVKTEGNLNTFSFLPSYLVRLQPKHKLLLLEMGMKSLNNIKRQCQVVRPGIGVVTNVGEAHAGSLGGLDLVVRAKQEMVDGVRPGGTLFLNADDEGSQKLSVRNFRGTLKKFGIHNPADIRGRNVRFTGRGMAFDVEINGTVSSFFIPTFGTHNVYNALAAIGVALELGSTIREIQKGLSTFRTPKMRLQTIRSHSGRLLINDAWNANPSAMAAGLEVLKLLSGSRPSIAVLGDMLELGNLTKSSHEKIGKLVAKLGINQLITIGKKGRLIAESAVKHGMNKNNVFSYSTHDQVVRHIRRTPVNSVVYFKASRKLKLEKVVQQLR